MGITPFVQGLLAVGGTAAAVNQQKKAEKASRRALEEANKVKATDLLPSTTSQTAESPEFGSSNRKSKRRGKSSLTIDRPTTTISSGSTGTGLNI
jgi:hypothetical protein